MSWLWHKQRRGTCGNPPQKQSWITWRLRAFSKLSFSPMQLPWLSLLLMEPSSGDDRAAHTISHHSKTLVQTSRHLLHSHVLLKYVVMAVQLTISTSITRVCYDAGL